MRITFNHYHHRNHCNHSHQHQQQIDRETATPTAIETENKVSSMLDRMEERGRQALAKKGIDRVLSRINSLEHQKARLKASIAQLAAEVASDVGEDYNNDGGLQGYDGLTAGEGVGVGSAEAMTEGEKEAARDRGRVVRVAQLEHERQRLLHTLETFDEVRGSSPRQDLFNFVVCSSFFSSLFLPCFVFYTNNLCGILTPLLPPTPHLLF